MKKKIFALLLAGTMIISGSAYTVLAESEETTESASESTSESASEETASDSSTMLTMAGVDEYNIVWSFVVDTETAVACISSTPEGEETTYISGPIVFDTEAGTFTITDEEDGNDYTFGYQDVSDTETIITYGEDNDQVQLAVVDQAVLSGENNYSVYAGFESNGVQLTIGIDWDNLQMAIDERDSSASNLNEGTFEVTQGDDETTYNVVFHPTEGNDVEMVFSAVNGEDSQMDVTIGEETIRITQVDVEALNAVSGETTAE